MGGKKRLLRRRSSRSLAGFAARDLCDTIPSDLPPSERLVMLLEKSFQFAFLAAQKDVMLKGDFDIESIRQEGADCWEKIKANISENDIHNSAVDKDGCDSCKDAKVKEANECIELMKAESERWTNKVLHYRENLKKEIDCSYLVKSSEVEKKCTLYDYSDILTETSKTEEKLLQQMQEVQSATEAIRVTVGCYKNLNICLKRKCAESFHKEVQRTPRTAIKGFAASSKIIKMNNSDGLASSSNIKTDDGDANK